MKLSPLFQFILGFILGVAILAVGATGLGFLFFARMASSPPKPVFSEEKKEETKVVRQETSEKKVTSDKPETSEGEKGKTEEEKKEEESTEAKEEELPAGAYKARVTWSEGLSLRAEPALEAERIGGVGYNSELIILDQSSDQKWQKVRLPDSDREGWIKAGNVRKVEEEN